MIASTDTLITRIAAALLLKHHEISVSEIRAIPFTESDEQAMIVARHLMQMFDVEVKQVKQQPSSISQWVDVLKLKVAPTESEGAI